MSGTICYKEMITMEYKREETHKAASAKHTIESNDAISKEDVEIRRLIEERRCTSKGEKQRLKDLRKQIKNASGPRKEEKERKRFNECSKTSEQEHPRNQICTKIKNESGEVLHQGRELPMFLGEFYKKLQDDQEHEETEQEHEENETESSIDVQSKDTSEMKRIPEIAIEEPQTAINRLKKEANLQTPMESEPKTSKLATKRRKRW